MNRVIEQYSETVFRISVLHTKNRADAEDICQDVFLSLLKRPFAEEDGCLKAWLIRITINKCKNFLKYQKRHKTVPLDAVSYSLAGESFKEEHLDLMDAFNKLAEKDRSVVYLFYFEDYTAKEIARLLGKNEAVVFKRLTRAREKLKNFLNEKGGQ
ncbi:MAG: RNA polymerase sigma factor [Firmicutes bacterium]|nr:RNA polymerase sigma factor [Bacillota bacterium]